MALHCRGGDSTSSLIRIDVASGMEIGDDMWVVYLDASHVSYWGKHLPHVLLLVKTARPLHPLACDDVMLKCVCIYVYLSLLPECVYYLCLDNGRNRGRGEPPGRANNASC